MTDENKKPENEKPFIIFIKYLMLALSIAMLSTMIFGGAINSYSIDFITTEDNIKAVFGILEKWQTFLAGIFGFVALLVGHMLNVSSQRKRDDEIRQQDKDDQDDALKAEQKSLAAAFYAELTIIKASAVSYQKWTEETRKANEGKEEWSIPFEVLDKFDLGHQTVLNPMLLKLAYCPTVFLEK